MVGKLSLASSTVRENALHIRRFLANRFEGMSIARIPATWMPLVRRESRKHAHFYSVRVVRCFSLPLSLFRGIIIAGISMPSAVSFPPRQIEQIRGDPRHQLVFRPCCEQETKTETQWTRIHSVDYRWFFLCNLLVTLVSYINLLYLPFFFFTRKQQEASSCVQTVIVRRLSFSPCGYVLRETRSISGSRVVFSYERYDLQGPVDHKRLGARESIIRQAPTQHTFEVSTKAWLWYTIYGERAEIAYTQS